MKTKYLTYLLPVLMLLTSVVMHAVSDVEQRKARHFALAAMQAAMEGDPASSHELYKRAHALDPDNKSVAYSLALGNFSMLDDTDSAAVAANFNLMREYVDAYPADYNEGEYYAYLCSLVGDMPEAIRVSKRVARLYPNRTELLPTIAGYFMQQEQLDSALSYYSRYEESEGTSPELIIRKSLVYLMKRDTVSALDEAGAFIRKYPEAANGYLIKASLLEHLGYRDSTLLYLERAAATEPDNGMVKVTLAQHYQQMGDSAKYEQNIYEALLSDDLELDQKLDILGDFVAPLIQKKDTKRGDKLFATLRDRYPHEPKIQEFAAQYSYAKGLYDDAAEQIGIAIDMDPENDRYRVMQLNYLLVANQDSKAVAAFESTPENIASDASFMYLGAIAYASDGRLDDALKLAHRMIAKMHAGVEPGDTLTEANVAPLPPKDRRILSDIYSLIGDTYYKRKDMPRASLAYDNALTAQPDNAEALNNYAYYLAESNGDLDRAEKMSAKAIELKPDFPTYLDTYAWILFRKGDYKEALKYQESVMEKVEEGEESAEYYEHLGDILFMNAQPARAVEMWEKALPLDPDNALLKRKIKHKTYFYE